VRPSTPVFASLPPPPLFIFSLHSAPSGGGQIDTNVLSTTVGHIAENCTSQERLCYNCRKPGHESSACTEPRTVAAKQCYSCGGIGHIQAECPTLRLQGSNQKCYVCMRASLKGGMNAERDVYIELRPFWAYCARVSERGGAGPWWLCVARAAAGSWIEHGVAPAYQVLSLRGTKPYGAVCVLSSPTASCLG
jgi:hypothetical protein